MPKRDFHNAATPDRVEQVPNTEGSVLYQDGHSEMVADVQLKADEIFVVTKITATREKIGESAP